MESKLEQQLVLWPAADLNLRLERVRRLMSEAGLEAVLLSDNTNAFYITGRIIRGYIYIEATGKKIFPENIVNITFCCHKSFLYILNLV